MIFLTIVFTLILIGISVTMFGYSWHISIESNSLKKNKNCIQRESVEFYSDEKHINNSSYASAIEGKDQNVRSSIRYHNSMYLDKTSFEKYKTKILEQQFPFQ